MLSVPTLWTVFVINFLALGLIWAYVMRSYPSFDAARFWTGSSFIAAAGAALAMLRMVTDSLLPLLAAGTALIFALCLAAMGIQKFFDQPVAWRATCADHGPELCRPVRSSSSSMTACRRGSPSLRSPRRCRWC